MATVLAQMIGLPYHRRQAIAPGVTLTFLDAGHVLGSAIVRARHRRRGPDACASPSPAISGAATCRSCATPRCPTGVDVPASSRAPTATGCTSPIEQMDDELAAVLARTHERGGKVVIPSFALERAQEVVFALKQLRSEARIPPMPVYVDSPLTVKHHRRLPAAPRVLRRRDARAAARRRLALRVRRPALHLRRRGLEGDRRRASEPCDHHLGERDVRGRARAAPPARARSRTRGTPWSSSASRRSTRSAGASSSAGPRCASSASSAARGGRGRRAERLQRARGPERPRSSSPRPSRERGPLRQVVLVHGEPRAQEVPRASWRGAGFLPCTRLRRGSACGFDSGRTPHATIAGRGPARAERAQRSDGTLRIGAGQMARPWHKRATWPRDATCSSHPSPQSSPSRLRPRARMTPRPNRSPPRRRRALHDRSGGGRRPHRRGRRIHRAPGARPLDRRDPARHPDRLEQPPLDRSRRGDADDRSQRQPVLEHRALRRLRIRPPRPDSVRRPQRAAGGAASTQSCTANRSRSRRRSRSPPRSACAAPARSTT